MARTHRVDGYAAAAAATSSRLWGKSMVHIDTFMGRYLSILPLKYRYVNDFYNAWVGCIIRGVRVGRGARWL